MQQYDPITVQRMLELLPQIERRKKKAKNARKDQGQFDQMQQRQGSGNYVPTQHGGLFETVAQYQKDYGKIGNQVTGAIGSYLTGKKADEEELAASDLSQQEQLRALEQLQKNRDSKGALEAEGGANNAALQGYLGLLGNETDVSSLIGGNKVRSTQKLANGNLGIVTDSGVEDTGIPFDYSIKTEADAAGKVFGIGTSGAGRGQATPVTFGGSPAPAPGQTPPPAPGAGTPEGWNGAAKVHPIDGLTPEDQARLQQMLNGVTDPTAQDMIVDMFMKNNIKEFGPEQAAGGVPAPAGQLTVATKGQEAFDVEQARINAQLGAADQVTQMEVNREGAKRRAVVEADRVAEIRTKLPSLRANVERARATINKLVESPGLKNITGRLGGMIPDPDSFPGAYQLFKSATAGTATGNALALHEQLRGQVFAVAFETLKGGGQITQIEGQKATEAAGRMTRAQSTEEYKAAAAEFVAAYEEGLRKLEAAGQNGYFDYEEAPAAPSAADPRAALRAKYGL